MIEIIRITLLVISFSWQMWKKLIKSEKKYHWKGAWRTIPKHQVDRAVFTHLSKGDPIDVANLMAFMWKRKLSCSPGVSN